MMETLFYVEGIAYVAPELFGELFNDAYVVASTYYDASGCHVTLIEEGGATHFVMQYDSNEDMFHVVFLKDPEIEEGVPVLSYSYIVTAAEILKEKGNQ